MRLKIFTTGGSIDKYYSTQSSSFEVGGPQAGRMLEEGNVTFEYATEGLMRKDSLEITPEDRQRIVSRVKDAPEDHILITHGTDTMVDTGRALLEELGPQANGKVIVLTGAMQPAAFRSTDAPFNTGGAVIALQTLPPGVYIVMNGQVFHPEDTYKNVALDRFEEAG